MFPLGGRIWEEQGGTWHGPQRELRSRRVMGGWDQKGRSRNVRQEWALIFQGEQKVGRIAKIYAFLEVCMEVATKCWWMCIGVSSAVRLRWRTLGLNLRLLRGGYRAAGTGGGDAELEVQWTRMSLEKREWHTEGRQSPGKSAPCLAAKERTWLWSQCHRGRGCVRRCGRTKMLRSEKSPSVMMTETFWECNKIVRNMQTIE